MSKIKGFAVVTVLVLTALFVAACVPGESPAAVPQSPETTTPPTGAGGTILLFVTDAPPDKKVTSVNVTLSSVEVHIVMPEQEQEQSGTANGTGTANQTQEQEQEQQQGARAEWITIPLTEGAFTFDLLQIQGIEQFVGEGEVPAGKYTQVRLGIDKIEVGLDGVLQEASVPGDKLKIVRPFEVVPGEATALVFDFEADKMVNVTGNGRIQVKPVIKLDVKPGKAEPTGPEEENSGEQEQEEAEEQEFHGSIDAISDNNTWTMTIDGESYTVDVTDAEINGEPAEGAEADVRGTLTDGIISAREVDITEPED